jgi:hypothetical protein
MVGAAFGVPAAGGGSGSLLLMKLPHEVFLSHFLCGMQEACGTDWTCQRWNGGPPEVRSWRSTDRITYIYVLKHAGAALDLLKRMGAREFGTMMVESGLMDGLR